MIFAWKKSETIQPEQRLKRTAYWNSRTEQGVFMSTVTVVPVLTVPGAVGPRLQSRGVRHFPGPRSVSDRSVFSDLTSARLLRVSRITAVFSKVRKYLTRCCSALNIYQSLCHSWRYSVQPCCMSRNAGPHSLRTWCKKLLCLCVVSGLPGHDGLVSHVSSGRGVPHSGKPRGHAGEATDGR